MTRRICVVTGIGVLAANGANVSEFANNLRGGVSGISPVTAFSTTSYCTSGAGVVRRIPGDPGSESKDLDRATHLAVCAANQAVNDSQVVLPFVDPSRVATTVGTSLGGWGTYLDALRRESSADSDTAEKSSTDCIPEVSPAQIASFISDYFGISGGSLTTTTACAAGSNAISLAMDLIRQDRCDLVVSVASDPLCELSYSGFNVLLAMTSGLCRPFDRDRAGLVVGEGAGAIIVEEKGHALARNAHIYCELAGYGLSNDAHHATQPDPEAGGACRAIRRALLDADADASEVCYINAHGTSTKYNDLMELTAINKIYGKRASTIPISSIKSMIGHTLGAAGMIEAVATILALDQSFLPPTINHLSAIPDFQYDFVPVSRPFQHKGLLASHSFGFGGNAVCLLFRVQRQENIVAVSDRVSGAKYAFDRVDVI
jgi:3-oxoacyl-[acyl-carrier-protein] synthase II